jgi:ribosomal protein S18 acetylase RimI-like enzyme
MPLPVINQRGGSPADLLRQYEQAQVRWSEHLSEEQVLDAGRAFVNAALREVWDANHVRDAALAEGMSPAEAVEIVDAHFAERGVRCMYWAMNSAAPPPRTEPLAGHLLAQGYTRRSHDLMRLEVAAAPAVKEVGGVKVIPARASFRHTRALFEEVVGEAGYSRQVVEADMAHLDDPHWDSLLALEGGAAVAHAGVFAVGELGVIENVYVIPPQRRRGLGSMMMGRVLEICARSLFRHVLLTVEPDNAAAQGLYGSMGFRKVGEVVDYLRPGARP